MAKRFSMAHYFLIGGGLLILLGLILWFVLPIPSPLPPYLPTGLLALGYGVFVLTRGRAAGSRKIGEHE